MSRYLDESVWLLGIFGIMGKNAFGPMCQKSIAGRNPLQ